MRRRLIGNPDVTPLAPIDARVGALVLAVLAVLAELVGLVPRSAGAAAAWRRPSPTTARAAGRAVMGICLAQAAGVPVFLAVGVGVAAAASGTVLSGRAAATAVRVRERELVEVLDLLALAIGAGASVHLAVDVVAHRAPGAVGSALAASAAAAGDGMLLADAVHAHLGPIGAPVDGLVAVLIAGLEDGAALGPALHRLVAGARAAERRRAETRARRVPVLLLFPLVLCTLPAFGLLTLAPVLGPALKGIRP